MSPNIIGSNFTTILNGTLVNGTNTNNLIALINNSFYIASNYSPSFLMRYEGNFTQDPNGNGIESIVNIVSLSDQGLDVYPDRIKVDYMYFNNINDNKICNVSNIQTMYHFVIPKNRIGLYQINSSGGNLTFNTTCP
jgi:hypothetical protein